MPPREPPACVEAEQVVLGAMMVSDEGVQLALDAKLKGDDFYRHAHRAVFDTIVGLYVDGHPHGAVAVWAKLQATGSDFDIGGANGLHNLVAAVTTPGEVPYFAEQILGTAVRRRTSDIGTQLDHLGYEEMGEEQRAAAVAQLMERLTDDTVRTDGHARPPDLEIAWLADLDQTTEDAVAWGLTDLDRLTGGFRPSQLNIVAARPGMGKSSLAIEVAEQAARHGHVVFATYEMSRAEVFGHLLSLKVPVNLNSSITMRALDTPGVADAIEGLRALNLTVIDDCPDIGTLSIEVGNLHRRDPAGVALVVVDYLQLIPSGLNGNQHRQEEVAAVSRALKRLAMRLKVPVLAVAQLSRQAEARTDRRPVLSDLRESGQLEQDADVVVFIYRDEMYDPESASKGEADLIVAKQRMGPTDTVTVVFDGSRGRFLDMAARSL